MRGCQRLWNDGSLPTFPRAQQRLAFTADANNRGFVSSDGEGNNTQHKQRIWVGPEVPLAEKLDAFLEAPPGDLHRLDIHLQANDLILECCKLGTLEGLRQAQDILNRILLEKRTKKSMMIAATPFETLIFGWVKKADTSTSKKMIELLRLMEKEHAYDIANFEPSDENIEFSSEASCAPVTATYNTILRGLARVATFDVQAAFTADDLVEEMIKNFKTLGLATKPNIRTFTHLIQAHGSTRLQGAADRVEKILKRVKAMHEEEKQRYETTYGQPFNLENPDENLHHIVTPDARLYSATILAIVNSEVPNSAERASDLLVEQLDSGCKVSAHGYNGVIYALANRTNVRSSPKQRFDAALRAEELALTFLEQHRDLCEIEVFDETNEEEIEAFWKKQLTIAFNVVINGWAKADVRESASRAQTLFKLMVASPVLQPDSHSLNVTLKALARSGDPLAAEELLRLVETLVNSGEVASSCKADIVSYCTVMSAWAKSNQADKTQRAQTLLSIIISKYEAGDMSMRPNNVAFTTVLNAAAHIDPSAADEKEEAYRIALHIYHAIITDAFALDVLADSFFFATMLKVVQIHTDRISTERRQMVEKVFDDACAAGQVSSLVIKELRLAAPDFDLLARLFRNSELAKVLPSVNQLPPAWSKEVPNHPRFRDVDSRSGARSEMTNSRQRRD